MRDYPVASVRFDLDPDGYRGTATWTRARPLTNDKVLLVMDGSESGLVLYGGEFRHRLDVLPGDVDNSGIVQLNDWRQVQMALLTSVANPGTPPHSYFAWADLNGDGRINAYDLAEVRRRLYDRHPTREPGGPSAAPLAAWSPTSDLFGSQPILPA